MRLHFRIKGGWVHLERMSLWQALRFQIRLSRHNDVRVLNGLPPINYIITEKKFGSETSERKSA